jgi:hypothetical protein
MNTLKKFEEHRGEEFLSSVASIGWLLKADKAEIVWARASHSRTCACDASWLESRKRMCHDLQRHQRLVKASQPPEAGGFWMAASGHYFSASKHEQKRRGEFKIPWRFPLPRATRVPSSCYVNFTCWTPCCHTNPDEPSMLPCHPCPFSSRPLTSRSSSALLRRWEFKGNGGRNAHNKRPKIITNIHSYDTYSGRMIYTDL